MRRVPAVTTGNLLYLLNQNYFDSNATIPSVPFARSRLSQLRRSKRRWDLSNSKRFKGCRRHPVTVGQATHVHERPTEETSGNTHGERDNGRARWKRSGSKNSGGRLIVSPSFFIREPLVFYRFLRFRRTAFVAHTRDRPRSPVTSDVTSPPRCGRPGVFLSCLQHGDGWHVSFSGTFS